MTEARRPLRMHGRDQRIYDALTEAGIIRENDYVRRVIIDINVTDAVVIHVERYGDERLLDVIRGMGGAVIRTGTPRRELVHLAPPDGQDITPCCGYVPSELPLGDRMTMHVNLVTCGLPDNEEST